LRRSSAMPELPTIDEAGIKGYDVSGWYGVIGPARLPRSIVSTLNQEINRIIQDPGMRETLSREGSDAMSSTPNEFAAIIASDIAKWSKVVKEAHIKLD
jgi:tripartite-type tricarboxylate transporter receptor subunit TctC